jgi:hypothetical protein
MSLILILNFFFVQIGMTNDLETISAICANLRKPCKAESLLDTLANIEGSDKSKKSVSEEIVNRFSITTSESKNGLTTWKKTFLPEKLTPAEDLIQGGATAEEALYFSTYYDSASELAIVNNLKVFEDRVKFFRFQFKTKRNKTECIKNQMENSEDICRATKNCSSSCAELDRPVIQSPSSSPNGKTPGKGSR